jgi:proline iminopeptidase
MPMLEVGDGHSMYYETHGNPKGRPVVVLHGGPGGGLSRRSLKAFDLKTWWVVLYDQRGCGKSTPRLSLNDNTTWHLVEDLETLRKKLGIETWVLTGGSWGSTLALAYAAKHLNRVSAFVLRAICLFTDEENQWTMEKGYASEVFPCAWKAVVKPLRKGTRKILTPYTRKLLNPQTRRAAAKPWTKWEDTLAHLSSQTPEFRPKEDEESAVLEAYYYSHNAWLTPELLLKAARLIRVPVILIQGRLDMICPMSSALLLKEAIPHAKLIVVPNAGHAMSQPGILNRLKKEFAKLA